MALGNVTASPPDIVVPLKGTVENPARDPKRAKDGMKGSIGDKAFMDGVLLVALAWGIILFLAISLRHHNV